MVVLKVKYIHYINLFMGTLYIVHVISAQNWRPLMPIPLKFCVNSVLVQFSIPFWYISIDHTRQVSLVWCMYLLFFHFHRTVSFHTTVWHVAIRSWKIFTGLHLVLENNLDSIVCIMTKLWGGWLRNLGSVPGREKRFFCSWKCPDDFWVPSSLLCHMQWGLSLQE
jgi:hypothetical protein